MFSYSVSFKNPLSKLIQKKAFSYPTMSKPPFGMTKCPFERVKVLFSFFVMPRIHEWNFFLLWVKLITSSFHSLFQFKNPFSKLSQKKAFPYPTMSKCPFGMTKPPFERVKVLFWISLPF